MLLRRGNMLVLHRSTTLLLITLLLIAPGVPSRLAASPGDDVPPTTTPLTRLRTSPMLHDLVRRMADRSPRFAETCARLERARGVYLRMRLDAPVRHGRYVARSVIARHEYGALVADITLHSPPDLVETIAHEFEHVLEQVERVDLHRLSRRKGSGVARTWSGDYETQRAFTAGRQVAAEYYAGPAELAGGTY